MKHGGGAARNSDLVDEWAVSPRSTTNVKRAANTISRATSSKQMLTHHQQNRKSQTGQLFMKSERVTKRHSIDYHGERDYLQEAKI